MKALDKQVCGPRHGVPVGRVSVFIAITKMDCWPKTHLRVVDVVILRTGMAVPRWVSFAYSV